MLLNDVILYHPGSAASARKISVDRLLSDVDADSEPSAASSNRRSSGGQKQSNSASNSRSASRQPSVDELEVGCGLT